MAGELEGEIQEYLTAAIQNIEVLIRYGKRPKKCAAIAMETKNRVEKEFTPLNHISQLLKLYNSLLNNRFS